MALQSDRSAQPMVHQHGGHVTTDSDALQITGQMPQTDQKHMGGSHIEPGAPETTWMPKVTGFCKDWEV